MMPLAEERNADLAQRAAEGDRICRQLLPVLITLQGDLDGDPESLKLIDEKAAQLKETMSILDPAAKAEGTTVFMSREAVVFMLGSYLGEMARRGLEPKGVEARWEAGGEGQISMRLSSLVIGRGGKEERWAVFRDTREWLDGRLGLSLYDLMKKLLSIA